eukprot:jgi/Ulvmu1/11210/UM072_0047.1
MSDSFVLIAHRGLRSHYPENTMSAFQGALEHGCTHFETDAQLTSDGACIIFHDDSLDRTTNGSGKVAETSAEALSQLDAGAWFSDKFVGERVPSLEAVLQTVGQRAHIHLELKSSQSQLPQKVAEVIQQNMQPCWQQGQAWDAPGLTITSSNLSHLQRSIKLLPGVRHAWLIQEVSDEVLAEAKNSGIAQICPRTHALTAGGAAKVLDSGFSLRAWGVRSTEVRSRHEPAEHPARENHHTGRLLTSEA